MSRRRTKVYPIVDLTAIPRWRLWMYMFGLFFKYNLEDVVPVDRSADPAHLYRDYRMVFRAYRLLRPFVKEMTCWVWAPGSEHEGGREVRP